MHSRAGRDCAVAKKGVVFPGEAARSVVDTVSLTNLLRSKSDGVSAEREGCALGRVQYGRLLGRQTYLKGGSAPSRTDAASDANRPIVVIDDSFGDAETETRASPLFSGEKRLKELGGILF